MNIISGFLLKLSSNDIAISYTLTEVQTSTQL